MARANRDGKFIISAGEIGTYSVCPESWRLTMIERIKPLTVGNVKEGAELHKVWSKNFDDAVYLTRGIRIVVLLLLLATMLYAIL